MNKLHNYFVIIFLFLINSALALENKILFKVNNEIITSIDILNESNYLKALNKNAQSLDKKTLLEISKNSIIREIIKKETINIELKNTKVEEDLLNNALRNIYENLDLKSNDELAEFVNNFDLNLDYIRNKISIEILWNRLIVSKFRNRIFIDEVELEKQLEEIKTDKIKQLSLSEIYFTADSLEEFNKKLIEIKNDITNKGFGNAAFIHSKSRSANQNGDLGWINENSLNQNVRSILMNIKIGEFTQPITVPGGYLLLELKEARIIENEIDIDKEREKLKTSLTNQQFNQFSNIYYKRIEKDTIINEL
ncbi:peptidylprolyl isomerase [Candidatus Pelagibacter sp. HIMB1321]|uniref:peptidylprolyl isomerase n=1 Tax=Candidatus Pelagibacter sp. HIMB1321 TaxID=1388755 RepID=UPI000A08089B|nr:peptidylprolyl isomerase [Candidatus Pelagibacter sp. HIMB1321]SMF72395.1 peptidyl-prolyl cis-trans isomerase SurA [Candidatus Pelagibacter sp. HIMB1321]